jgi:class 3 adenylate cyclase/tetratricopeptide (TPR) repeat protein
MICPVCGTANPDHARFCLECGSALTGRASEGERRIVTMLFCDVVGSTAMAERLDPEAWTEIMNEVFEVLIAPIHRYEGTLARLMGDAIFAFFGAPTAHEDDPIRAVRAGLEIVEAITAHRAEGELDLNVRVGINTGPVVVGEVGSERSVEYTAMGDAVNVAARMEQTAEPGTVRITEETARLVGDSFELGPGTPIAVKGKETPVIAHVVLGRRSRARAVVQPASWSATLVGRDLEMETLRVAVNRTLEGRGRMVALVGEAGLGKSRLIDETRRVWNDLRPETAFGGSDIRRLWETWRCVSYDRTRPYAQYRRVLSALAGIADTDLPEVVREKLAATVEAEATEWLEPHMRVWRSLFGVPEPGEEPLEGEAFREAITELVPRATRWFSAEPRMFVFEDLHWCDDASMDLLIETASALEDLPALLLFAFRPDVPVSERLRRWMAADHLDRSSEIVLAPLSADASVSLIDQLVPGAPDSVRAELLARTEGNPLFLEEFATTVRTQGADPQIPATLQALITARLDTLDDDARRTLQLASVIGRSFGEPELGAVAGDGMVLRERLETLERAGLISRTAIDPDREYAFHHSLTQEAAYGTILLRERRELHLQVGEALERRYAARIEEYAPVLAFHFERAGDDARTVRYASVAGDHAARLYANADAIEHYDAAIDAATRLGDGDELFGHLYPSRGRAMQLAGRYDDAERNYEEMRARAEASGNRAAALEAIMSLTTLYTTATSKFDAERGERAAHRAVELARDLGDRAAESKALWNLMNLFIYSSGDQREALEAGERSLELAREADAHEQMAFTMTDLWRPYASAGDLAAARRTLEEARPIWRELENLPMLTENLAGTAQLSYLTGDDDRALSLALEGHSVAESTGNLWGQAYASMAVFEVYADRGDLGRSIDLMREAIDAGERVGFLAPSVTTRATLGVLYAYVGDRAKGLDAARGTLDVATDRLPSARPWPLMCLAEIHLLAGDPDQADGALEDCDVDLLPELARTQASLRAPLLRGGIALARKEHDRAIEVADTVLARLERMGVRYLREDALLLKGRALASAGMHPEAEGALREARATATAAGHRRILWEILAALADVVADDDERERLLAEGREIVLAMAATLDEELRKRFVDRPAVQAIFNEGEAD